MYTYITSKKKKKEKKTHIYAFSFCFGCSCFVCIFPKYIELFDQINIKNINTLMKHIMRASKKEIEYTPETLNRGTNKNKKQ